MPSSGPERGRNGSATNSRIVGGQGTENRPWIVDEEDRGGSIIPSQQQRIRQSLLNQRQLSNETRSSMRSARRELSEVGGIRRTSTSDAQSVASGESSSSYDRYLAQKRAEQQRQKELAFSIPAAATPSSPILEKHYAGGKAVLVAPSKRDSVTHRRLGKQDSNREDVTIPTMNPRRSSLSQDAEGKESVPSSRDLRSRRLVAQQQRRSLASTLGTTPSQNISTATKSDDVAGDPSSVATVPPIPLHFQAHDAAVEKYLMRSRADSRRSRSARPPPPPSQSEGATAGNRLGLPTAANTRSRLRSDGVVHAPDAASQDIQGNALPVMRNRTMTDPSKTTSVVATTGPSHTSSNNSLQSELPNNAPSNDTSIFQRTTGWSTMKPASSTGYHNLTSEAIAAHDAYTEETARTTIPLPLGTGSHKVDEYLAQRNSLKMRASGMTRLGKPKADAATESSVTGLPAPSVSVSFEESCEDESIEDSSGTGSEGETENDATIDGDDDPSKEWSVKVCVISAIDFPASVVPNLPFSPLLKFGLIQMNAPSDDNPQDHTDKPVNPKILDQRCKELSRAIEQDGLSHIPNSRIRCTGSKVLSKRDNGSVEFHEELRWNRIKDPHRMALALELSSKAVLTPSNFRDSPPQQKVGPFMLSSSAAQNQSTTRRNLSPKPPTHKESAVSVIGSMFRTIRKSDSAEMEEANAAAAVAKHLVRGHESETSQTVNCTTSTSAGQLSAVKSCIGDNQNEVDVKLRRRKIIKKMKMTEDLRLGAKVVPFSCLPLANAMNKQETVRIEQWFEIDTCKTTVKTSLVGTSPSSSTAARNPSILLEIRFSSFKNLDDSEDELDGEAKIELKSSYSKRASLKIRKQLKQEVRPPVEKPAEPVLEPGIIDFVCVVGARDIGDQKDDDGASGWVNATPECCVLEQFPPNDEFHAKRGRSSILPGKVEWFCFPEGCKLWRGLTPPNHDELNLKRFSAAASGHISSSIASFDACLGCTASFSWFVIASNSDQYGSESKKTYGAVIRFFVPAPTGIDPTQDDFAQTFIGACKSDSDGQSGGKRLWVPIGICLTSCLPIVGTMEVMLMRLCENLSSSGSLSSQGETKSIREALVCAIVSFQKPIPGVVNCSFPFLHGDRLHVAVPSRTGLPPLPHGSSVAAVCRLLGADGINFLLAAFLTECKILLHSDEVANLSLVAEVLSALIYPFDWALPYIPVLPSEMMEFVEAPVSFLIGVPSCNMCLVDPSILEDIVVVDLDRDFSTFDYFEGRRNGLKTKSPIPLPASVASNIAKAVHRLIRADNQLGASGTRPFPRIQSESLPEKEFRVSVALEVCSLIRGFDECLVFSSSQPVFNVDKFLQVAPSIFEEQRDIIRDQQHDQSMAPGGSRNVISPRSRRFVSSLVCCQHFHQFLEVLESDLLTFFHAVMRTLQAKSARKDKSLGGMLFSLDSNPTVLDLCKMLQKVEDKTPTYRVKSLSDQWSTLFETEERKSRVSSKSVFPLDLLRQITFDCGLQRTDSGFDGVRSVSVDYLVELEKNPWLYQNTLDLNLDSESSLPAIEKVKLREAIGDRRYKAWKAGYDKFDGDECSIMSEDTRGLPSSLDLRNLVASVAEEFYSQIPATGNENDNVALVNARDCDALRQCLENATRLVDAKRDFLGAAEIALQNPAAQKFLLAILGKRARRDEKKTENETTPARRRSLQYGGSKLDSSLFDLLILLSFSMLDVCDVTNDFESAYQLLKLTAGLYAVISDPGSDVNIVYVTERIGLHSIYSKLTLWERIKDMYAVARKDTMNGDAVADCDEEYEAVVATLYEMNGYGIPANYLARFASRMCDCNGWFHSEKGQTILMLAKRVGLRRDGGHASATPVKFSDLELISPSPRKRSRIQHSGSSTTSARDFKWIDIGWCHPAAQSSRRTGLSDSNRRPTQNISQRSESTVSHNPNDDFMKRSAVTSLAYLGSSVVVSGGLDGGVFLARQAGSVSNEPNDVAVRGVHLDWGSSGSRYTVGSASTTMDGEYGVGAVTCLAATHSNLGGHGPKHSFTSKDVLDKPPADEEILTAMEGCRVVAGTTCGDLRVWSVKDVLSAVFFASRSAVDLDSSKQEDSSPLIRSSGAASTMISSRGRGGTDFAAGTSLTRLKFSLRGRALSGHRGGVSCIDVHSNVYRPDSIVSGGADGLIKLWSLRTPGTSGGRRSSVDPAVAGTLSPSSVQNRTVPGTKGVTSGGSGDALSILSGHGGRILSIKTAWHGDRLLSGGADRTVRLWDLAGGSGGKCLNILSGHFGWVTQVEYWGPNTIISASTDRSVGLWDIRVSNAPLFVLRHHGAPISDLLVEPNSDSMLISAAMDGSVAAWDFRNLTTAASSKSWNTAVESAHPRSKVVRDPAGILFSPLTSKADQVRRIRRSGAMHLAKGVSQRRTVQCLGGDAVVREWDYQTGDILYEQATGHCDAVSSFVALAGDRVLGTQLESAGPDSATATLSASWDGTIRMRKIYSDP
jgi:WD40 repeat protein